MAENHRDDDKTHTHIPLLRDTMVGHYRIVEKIGAGGMGEVYLAEDTELDRRVALKFLPLHLCHDQECRARFKREAQAAAKLSHPNIIHVYEVSEYKGRPFFAMEHIEGQSLKEYSAGKELSIEKILELGLQICEGLQAAHDKGITHRDIKPSNILIDSHGYAHIVDFGLALVVGTDQLTKTGSTLGTIGYMSPEQAEGKRVDSRSDVFSVGVLLYELLTGKQPFLKDSDAATLLAVVNEQQNMIVHLNPGVPQVVQDVVNRALEKKPDNRYFQAGDFASAIKSVRSGISGRDTASPSTFIQKRMKNIIIVVAGVSLAAIITVAFILPAVYKPGPIKPVTTTFTQMTFSGKAAHPSISPIGDYLAYATQGEGVWIQELPGGRPISLFEARRVTGLSWSPDGRTVAISAITDSIGKGLFLVRPLERSFRKVSNYLASGRLSWSPNGQTLAFAGKRKIILLNIPTADTVSLAVKGNYDWLYSSEWSPAGNWIAFSSAGGGNRRLWLISPDGSIQNSYSIEGLVTATWLPSGEAIYCRIFNHGLEDLVRIPVETSTGHLQAGSDTVLNALELAHDDVSVSGDGRYLAYVREMRISNLWHLRPSEDTIISVMSAEPLTQGTAYIGAPNVSPDGSMVAFGQKTPTGYQIYILPTIGGELTQITHLNASCSNPVWSADGKQMAFICSDSSGYRVGSVSLDGYQVHLYNKTETSNIAGGLTWFPGEKILYLNPSQDNWNVLDPETEHESPLFPNETKGAIYGIRYSPDGSRVAFNYVGSGFESSGIYIMKWGDSIPELISGNASLIDWTDDGHRIYASVRTEDRKTSIAEINIESGTQEIIGFVPMRQPGAITKVPGSEEFVFTVGEALSDIWLAEDFDPYAK